MCSVGVPLLICSLLLLCQRPSLCLSERIQNYGTRASPARMKESTHLARICLSIHIMLEPPIRLSISARGMDMPLGTSKHLAARNAIDHWPLVLLNPTLAQMTIRCLLASTRT